MLKKDYFKKNLLRVKQIADQNLGRAEKTDALTEDLIVAEKKVDLIKQTCQTTTKKIQTCLQGSGTDYEKRLKKLPEMSLSHSMTECSSLLGEECLLGKTLKICSDGESGLSHSLVQYEMGVEQNVLHPLQSLLDHEIPSINKQRKQLSKLVLDMDSARTRYQSACRQTQSGSMNKAENLKDEMEEASNKVYQCRDALSTEMFQFVAREAEYSEKLAKLIELQADYHRKALKDLDHILPKLKQQISNHHNKPLYGHSLQDHLRVTERDIAFVIEECVLTLMEIGMEEEGLFRIAGSTSKVKKLKASFDAGFVAMEDYVHDVHCVSGALKLYLRELPEPLLTFDRYGDWMAAAQQQGDHKLQSLWNVLDTLPKHNYDNLRYLVKFLAQLAKGSDVNKMTPSNIAIVIGPNLIWSQNDGGPNVLTTGTQSSILESLILHSEWFFPGEVEYIKFDKGSRNNSPRPERSNCSTGGGEKARPQSLSAGIGLVHHTLLMPVPGSKNPPLAEPENTDTIEGGFNINSPVPLSDMDATLDLDSPMDSRNTDVKIVRSSSDREKRQSLTNDQRTLSLENLDVVGNMIDHRTTDVEFTTPPSRNASVEFGNIAAIPDVSMVTRAPSVTSASSTNISPPGAVTFSNMNSSPVPQRSKSRKLAPAPPKPGDSTIVSFPKTSELATSTQVPSVTMGTNVTVIDLVNTSPQLNNSDSHINSDAIQVTNVKQDIIDGGGGDLFYVPQSLSERSNVDRLQGERPMFPPPGPPPDRPLIQPPAVPAHGPPGSPPQHVNNPAYSAPPDRPAHPPARASSDKGVYTLTQHTSGPVTTSHPVSQPPPIPERHTIAGQAPDRPQAPPTHTRQGSTGTLKKVPPARPGPPPPPPPGVKDRTATFNESTDL